MHTRCELRLPCVCVCVCSAMSLATALGSIKAHITRLLMLFHQPKLDWAVIQRAKVSFRSFLFLTFPLLLLSFPCSLPHPNVNFVHQLDARVCVSVCVCV